MDTPSWELLSARPSDSIYKDSIRKFTGESEAAIDICVSWVAKAGASHALTLVDCFARKYQRLPVNLIELKVFQSKPFAQEIIMQFNESQ